MGSPSFLDPGPKLSKNEKSVRGQEQILGEMESNLSEWIKEICLHQQNVFEWLTMLALKLRGLLTFSCSLKGFFSLVVLELCTVLKSGCYIFENI